MFNILSPIVAVSSPGYQAGHEIPCLEIQCCACYQYHVTYHATCTFQGLMSQRHLLTRCENAMGSKLQDIGEGPISTARDSS